MPDDSGSDGVRLARFFFGRRYAHAQQRIGKACNFVLELWPDSKCGMP